MPVPSIVRSAWSPRRRPLSPRCPLRSARDASSRRRRPIGPRARPARDTWRPFGERWRTGPWPTPTSGERSRPGRLLEVNGLISTLLAAVVAHVDRSRVDHAAVALGPEDDVVRVGRLLVPVDFPSAERDQASDLGGLVVGVQVEMDAWRQFSSNPPGRARRWARRRPSVAAARSRPRSDRRAARSRAPPTRTRSAAGGRPRESRSSRREASIDCSRRPAGPADRLSRARASATCRAPTASRPDRRTRS